MNILFFGTYDRTYTSNKLMLQGLAENDVKVVEVNSHIKVTRLDKAQDMTWFHLLRRIWNKHKILVEIFKHWSDFKKTDAIYVGYPGHFDVLLAYPLAKLFGKKLIFNPLLIIYIGFAEEQGILKKRSLMGSVIKFAESMVYKMCDLVFADTPFQKEFLLKDFGVPERKLRVLSIGADDKYYHYTPYTNTQKKINAVYYGLYSPIHGVEHLIEAARLLNDDPAIHFTMVGNGNTFEQNYQRAQALKLKNITFYHNTPEAEHPSILAKADVFFGFLAKHPTVDRVIPNKVYQGLAMGKLVLTADAPVSRSVFKDKENMYLCPPADPQALAKALVELKNNPSMRMKIAHNGYDLFKREFTPKAVGRELVKYVQEIL